MSNSTVAPAALVRAFFNDPVKGAARTATLTKGAKSVAPGSRGRLHPEAIAGYNKGKPAARRYVTGNTGAVVSDAKASAKALRVAAISKGLATEGSRGPLSKEAQAALGVAKPAKRSRKG